MTNVFQKNEAINQEDAEKIIPRAEFRVFGQGIISNLVNKTMWEAHAKLF